MSTFNGIQSYAEALKARIASSDALLIAVKDITGVIGERIFEEGKAVNGNIGKYSTEPTYIGDKNSPKAGTKEGKYGEKEFKDGTPHKTTYYNGGYSEYRSAMGRKNDKVNLNLTGRLETNFLNGIVELDTDEMGIKLRGENVAKAKGGELRFAKPIFELTKKERARFKKTLSFEVINALRNA